MNAMLEKVRDNLSKTGSLWMEKPMVVGVSGGPDSMALVHVLSKLDCEVVVGHLNHGLREEAKEDAATAGDFADKLGVPFYSEERDTRIFAEERGFSIEEAARNLRYDFLFRVAVAQKAGAVVVGHTADDKVVTVLRHLLRGAGLDGLKGMEVCGVNPTWHEEIPILRPLLDVWREEILTYCVEVEINPQFDQSNLDQTYFRNRLRHDLIPSLADYNPKIKQLVWRTADVLAGDHAVLEQLTVENLDDCDLAAGKGYVSLDLERFLDLFPGMRRRVLRRMIGVLKPGLRDIDFEAVARGLGFVEGGKGSGLVDLVGGLQLTVDGGRVWVMEEGAKVRREGWLQIIDEGTLGIPGMMKFEGGWRLEMISLPVGDVDLAEMENNEDGLVGWVDADTVGDEVVVRGRRAGDRVKLLGMRGQSMKVADFYINAKMPRLARERWPLVCTEGEVVWIPGYRVGHDFRVTEATKRVLCLRVHSPLSSGES